MPNIQANKYRHKQTETYTPTQTKTHTMTEIYDITPLQEQMMNKFKLLLFILTYTAALNDLNSMNQTIFLPTAKPFKHYSLKALFK